LRSNLKYIILSATANRDIYNFFFREERIQFYECRKVKYLGVLNQYPQYTMSRAFIDKNPDKFEKAIRHSGFDDIITFKKYKKGNYYFGKISGVDTLRGKNLTIIGTPHHPEWIYKLFLYSISHPLLFEFYKNSKMRYQKIKHNGHQFYFMSFDKEAERLRDIQLWMIESELEQTVGRARLSRNSCTVNLFSDFPLRQANIKQQVK
jgi:hypothetical protein